MEEKIWSVGQGENSREIPLEVKRRFAWVFACDKLPRCVDSGAVIDMHDGGDVFVRWSDLTFKLAKYSDISDFAERIEYAAFALPKVFPDPGEGKTWNFFSADTKTNFGLSSLLAAKYQNIEKIFCFESASSNIEFNPEFAEKFEIIPDGAKAWEKISDDTSLLVEVSLAGVDDPLALISEIKDSKVSGVSVLNNAPSSEKELPQKVISVIEEAGFKGTASYKVFIGWRE